MAPSCTTNILFGALHSYWPPQAAHHQLHFFFLLLRSPCPIDTHHMWSSKGKQLPCGQTYDKVTPHNPSTYAMIRLKKSLIFSEDSCAMLRRPISSVATCSYASRILSKVHSQSFFPFCIFHEALPIAMLHCAVRTARCLATAICITTSFDLFQNLLEGRLLLPLTLLSFMFFFRSIRYNLSCTCPLKSETLPHSARKLFTPKYLPQPASMRLSLHHHFPFP